MPLDPLRYCPKCRANLPDPVRNQEGHEVQTCTNCGHQERVG